MKKRHKVTACLTKKSGKAYIIINYHLNGKRKQKWISTGLAYKEENMEQIENLRQKTLNQYKKILIKNTFSDITILIDIDDTLEDLLGAWCKYLNEKYGLSIQPDEVTDWDIAKFFPTLTKEQVFEPVHTDNFWKTVEPKDGAVKYVKQLIDDGFNVYLCTTTDYRNVKPKFEYIILKHFPFIPWQQVIVASCKQMIKADFLIDDGIHNHEGGDYIKILVSTPHNRWYDAEANGMIRSENWKFTYDTIISFAEKIIGGE